MGEQIFTSASDKHLGVIIDSPLNFKNRAYYLGKYVPKKFGKRGGYFARILQDLSLWCRRIVYHTLIYPDFT